MLESGRIPIALCTFVRLAICGNDLGAQPELDSCGTEARGRARGKSHRPRCFCSLATFESALFGCRPASAQRCPLTSELLMRKQIASAISDGSISRTQPGVRQDVLLDVFFAQHPDIGVLVNPGCTKAACTPWKIASLVSIKKIGFQTRCHPV
jgi:hypothetical protein